MYTDERDRSGCGGIQLVIGLIIAVASVVTYFGHTSTNPITGDRQHIDITADQEIALGLQAAPEMASQYGGEDSDAQAREHVEEVGQNIVSRSDATKTPYKFQFHDLADDQTINAFALPGGQVFITRGLLTRLKSDGELAAVLSHECGHVVARHSAQQIAKAKLTQGLTGAAVIASYDPHRYGVQASGALAILISQLVTLKFSRNDELEADKLGVKLMSEAGYDPRAMIDVMEILKQASAGGKTPEFFSTHPSPENREEHIDAEIAALYPKGVPVGLKR